MATVTTLRPSSVASGVGWTATPSGTLYGVTSDNSDSTYAAWSGSGSAMILGTPVDSPPVGERRHQVRLRARGEDGDAWWAVRLANGNLVAAAATSFTASPGTVTGSWGFGAPADGPTILSAYMTGQSTGLKIEEIYLDVDTRLAPTFTPQVLDGTGTPNTAVSDTAQPTLHVNDMDLDDLSARSYRYWVTQGSTIIWDTGLVSGSPADRQVAALDNGSYVAHLQIWSTLGSNTAYASDEETLAFSVDVGAVAAPANPVVTAVPDSPLFEISVCAPEVSEFDGGVGWIEIQRVDCDASVSVAMIGPLATYECGTWTDYSLPRTGVGQTCEFSPEPCCSYYRARTVVRMNDLLQVSNWSDFYQQPEAATLRDDYDTSQTWLTIVHDDPSNGWPLVHGTPYDVVSGGEEMTVLGISQLGSVAEVDGTFESGVDTFGWRSEGCTFAASAVRGSQGTANSVVVTVNASPAQAVFRNNEASLVVAADPGQTFVAVMDVWSAVERTINATLDWRDDDGWFASTDESFVVPAGVWTSIGVAGTAPAGTTNVGYGPSLRSPAPANGTQFWVDEINIRRTDIDNGHQLALVQRGVNGPPESHDAGDPIDFVTPPEPPDDPVTFCLVWDDDEHLIRTEDASGPLWIAIGGQFSWDRDRPFTASTGIMGTRFITSGAPGGRNQHLTTAVESEAELALLQRVLARPLVLISPSDADETWSAPVNGAVAVIKVGRVRQVVTDFTGTGPQPAPQLADVG